LAPEPEREQHHDAIRNVERALDEIRQSRLRLLGVAVLCAKVILVPVIFDHSLDMPFVVSKAELSHGLAWALLAVMGMLFLLHGRGLFKWSWLYVPVAVFVAVSVLSALFAANLTIALYGTHARMLGLVSTFDFAILFVAITALVRTRNEAVVVGASVVLASIPVLGYEVIQMSGRDPFSWSNASVDRPFSTLGEATALAQYLMVLALGMFATAACVRWFPRWLRLVCFAYSGLLLAGAIATGTRSALIGLAAGATVFVLTSWLVLRGRGRVFLTLTSGLAVIAITGGVLLTPLGARLLSTVLLQTSQGTDASTVLEPSAAGRLVLYSIALDMVRERPLLGYGPDNFMVGVPTYRPVAAPIPFRDGLPSSDHSWVSHVATGSGLLGLACFIAIIFVATTLTLRHSRNAAAVIGCVMLAGFLGTGLTSVNEFGTEWLFWLSIGSIAAATLQGPGAGRDGPNSYRGARGARHQQRPKGVASALILAGGLALTFAPIAAWEASRAAASAGDLRLSGKFAEALDSAVRATRLDPGRAEYWHTLGLSYAALNRWSDAVGSLDRATAAAPFDSRYLGDLANASVILASQGKTSSRDRARELGDRLVRLDPNSPQANLTRAAVMQFLGDFPQALSSVERALVLDPDSVNQSLYITAAQVMIATGRPNDAIEIAGRGLLVFGATTQSVAIRVELARALMAAGRPREALAALDIALVIEPTNVAAESMRQTVRAGLPK
jgi:tetratricopeptide (TPR) repeat protein/O-antigen ligase